MKSTIRAAALAAFGAAATLGAAGAPAEAANLRFAVGSPPNSLGDNAANYFAEKLNEFSGGEVTAKIYPLSLLNLMESNTGLRDGIADIATVLWPYFLAEYPETNLAAELAALSELVDGNKKQATLAYLGAVSEYVALHCPECREETLAQNQVFLAGLGTSAYILQCMKKVTTVEDMKGLRIRAGGAWWTRWANAMGATPVSMSINETFEGLSQGVLDCTASNPAELTQFGFIDAVEHITTGVPGSSFAFGMGQMNRDTWLSLSDDEKTQVLHAAAYLSGDGIMAYFDDGEENVGKLAPEKGIEIYEADPALVAKSKAWIEEDLASLGASYEERFEIKDAAAKTATLRKLIDEWLPRMEGVETRDQLAEVLWENVQSKIDVATYGQ